jgi:putative spermidine/putrescine transport system substrate-binding protein
MEEEMTRKIRMSRRSFLASIVATSVASPFIWPRRASAAQKLYVRTPGGKFDDIKREAIYEPFRKETGIEIVPVPAPSGKLMAMARSGASGLDVIDTGNDALLELHKAGYLKEIPYSEFKYTDIDDINPVVKRKFQIGSFIYALVLAYNTKVFPDGKEPKSWEDFWDIKNFPGKRTLEGMEAGVPALEQALLADGVPADKLYPLDIKRAFKSLSRIRSAIPKFWDSGALSVQLLANNEVAMGGLWSTRVMAAANEGVPIGIQWNQNAVLVQSYGIPVDSSNVEAAVKYIDYASSAEAQARWLSKYHAIPINKKAYSAASKEVIDPDTNKPWTESKGFVLDIDWWAKHREEVSDYWSDWIIG